MAGDERSSSRRSVHFPQKELATVVCEIEDLIELSAQDKNALWFSRSDYSFCKSSARVLAKESERYGHSKHLDKTFIPTFEQDAQDSLNLWALHGSQRRGLERWANSTHGDLRKKDQDVYFQTLLRAQTEMNLKGVEEGPRAQRLQEIGSALSKRSCLFATMIAKADAEAAKWELKSAAAAAASAATEEIINLSPRQALKKQSQSYRGTRTFSSSSVSRATVPAVRRATTSALPNLQGIAPRRRPLRRSNTAASPRITIRTRPARVSRMA